ncbi:MAG: CgeB family protein [Xenococcaceae cyanobacterium]
MQYQAMVEDCFGWADFWTRAFGKLGYEVWEPVSNARWMQKAWARENNISFREKNWLEDITIAQVKYFQPDLLFVDDYETFTCDLIRYLRQECPSIKLVLGWCGAPYINNSVFRAYDITLSNIRELVNKLQEQGHKAEYIKHAFEPLILEKINTQQEQTVDFSFLGSIFKTSSAHLQRELFIKKLVQKTNLQIWSDLSSSSANQIKILGLRQLTYDLIKLVSKLPFATSILSGIPKIHYYVDRKERPSLADHVDPEIVSATHPPLYGLSMFQQLHNSKVTFNNHINVSSKSASNMRLYEATGVGTCLLTDWKENLNEIFEPDREVVTYRCPEECIEKVRWLLEHPQERKAIAQAGQVRTLKDHTFDRRAIELDALIKQHLLKNKK